MESQGCAYQSHSHRDASQMLLRYLQFTRKLKFLQVGTEHIFQSNEDMTAAMDQDATLENRNQHAILCDRDDLQADMEYTYMLRL